MACHNRYSHDHPTQPSLTANIPINLPRLSQCDEIRFYLHHQNNTLLHRCISKLIGLQIQFLLKNVAVPFAEILTHTRNAWAKKQNLFSLFLRQEQDMTAQDRSLVGWWGASGRSGLICRPPKTSGLPNIVGQLAHKVTNLNFCWEIPQS